MSTSCDGWPVARVNNAARYSHREREGGEQDLNLGSSWGWNTGRPERKPCEFTTDRVSTAFVSASILTEWQILVDFQGYCVYICRYLHVWCGCKHVDILLLYEYLSMNYAVSGQEESEWQKNPKPKSSFFFFTLDSHSTASFFRHSSIFFIQRWELALWARQEMTSSRAWGDMGSKIKAVWGGEIRV